MFGGFPSFSLGVSILKAAELQGLTTDKDMLGPFRVEFLACNHKENSCFFATRL